MLNDLLSTVLYILCVPKEDLFIAYGPSVATVVSKHLGLTTSWLLCISCAFISDTFSEIYYVEEHSL